MSDAALTMELLKTACMDKARIVELEKELADLKTEFTVVKDAENNKIKELEEMLAVATELSHAERLEKIEVEQQLQESKQLMKEQQRRIITLEQLNRDMLDKVRDLELNMRTSCQKKVDQHRADVEALEAKGQRGRYPWE